MRLVECFDKYDCDKGHKHRYDRIYEPILEPLRDQPITLLEIGVLRGASLSAWLDYFSKAKLIGIDTFGRVPAEAVPILEHPRVTWFACDSTKTAPDVMADIIIDDGYHTPEAQLATFRKYFPLLNDGGVYFIEDCAANDSKDYELLKNAVCEYGVRFYGKQCKSGAEIIEVRRG